MNNIVKRLFIDIETGYIKVPTFTLWPNFIPHDHILEDWHIICACWKWEGEDEVHGELTYTKNDKKVVKALREAIIEADEIVYHNGKKFDFKKLNTRVLLNGLEPMPKPRETDTLIQAKRHFSFTSNRLDYLGWVLCDERKMETDKDLWLKALHRDKDAINQMFDYNKQDVLLLEKVFHKMASHIEVGYNLNINQQYGDSCPGCGSYHLQSRGWRNTKIYRYRRYQCQSCKKWCSSGTKEKRLDIPVR